MSRRSKKMRVAEPFALMPLSLFQSPAFKALSWDARRVLDRLMVEHLSHGGFTHAGLVCTYGDFEAEGIRRKSIAGALRELVAMRLVEVVKQGKPSIATRRQPSEYRLTFLQGRNSQGTTMPTEEWRQIETAAQAEQLLAEAATVKSPVHVRRATVAAGRKGLGDAELPKRARAAA